MWIRELAIGWERVYKPSEHASASVTRGTRDAVPTPRITNWPRNFFVIFLLANSYISGVYLSKSTWNS
jgi:hypothetical protein